MISPVVKISQDMVEKKRIKTKIGVVSVVKAKIGYMEEKARDGRSIRMIKYVVGYVQAVVGNNIFLIQRQKEERDEFFFASVFMFEIGGMP